MATFTKLKSGSWRVQVRRKGKYVSETFLRRKDAEEWAIDEERRIDRGEPSTKRNRREARTLGDLVRLHLADLREVGKPIGRSKAASLQFLESRLGACKISELDRERLIQFGKERAREGAGAVTWESISDTSRQFFPTPPPCMELGFRWSRSSSRALRWRAWV